MFPGADSTRSAMSSGSQHVAGPFTEGARPRVLDSADVVTIGSMPAALHISTNSKGPQEDS
mgnify:CR=1 FL=1